MKRIACVIVFISVCIAGAWAQTATVSADSVSADDRGYLVKVGDMVPDFTMNLADGSTIRMSDLRGRVVMLQFTASWCSVCRKEMPFIEKDIWQKHQSNPGFALFGIDKDEKADVVSRFAQSVGVTYPLVPDHQSVVFELFAHPKAGVTRNVIVGRDGRIVMLTRLFNQEEFNSMVHTIDRLLEEQK